MRRLFLIITIFVVLSVSLFATPRVAVAAPHADNISADDLINWTNSIRASYGHPALRVDPILMQTAQSTAETMAASHLNDHIGNVSGRVAAAGYGGGAKVYATENWAAGPISIDKLFNDYWADSAHLLPMTEGQYIDIGAGVAVADNGQTYYIIHAAFYEGETRGSTGYTPVAVGTSSGTGGATLAPAQPTRPYVNTILTSTPNAVGAIVHVVQPGETIWSISYAYKVTVDQVISMNGLEATPVIYPNEKLIIHSGPTSTPLATPTPTAGPPTKTPLPTSTARPTRTPAPTRTPTPPPGLFDTFTFGFNRQTVGLVLIIVCVLGLLYTVGSSALGKKKKQE